MHRNLRAVTFDCWGTLIYEPKRELGDQARIQLFTQHLREQGLEVSEETARDTMHEAWKHHWQQWKAGVSTGALDMARWGLEAFGIHDSAAVEKLGTELQEVALHQEVIPLYGARETLTELARRNIRRALICDTGFSPARVVRQLLEREGLLEFLEVLVFSDEQGVPKPDPRVFHAALGALEVEPAQALHVGDLRRTDIAGARAFGMRSVRIRWQHDDPSELPDADAVADSHAHLRQLLGLAEG